MGKERNEAGLRHNLVDESCLERQDQPYRGRGRRHLMRVGIWLTKGYQCTEGRDSTHRTSRPHFSSNKPGG